MLRHPNSVIIVGRLLNVTTPLVGWMWLATMGVGQDIDFDRDIRPILSENCFQCHGPDEGQREADLRLDLEQAAKESVIVEGRSAESELLARITTVDEDLVMPPRDIGKELSPAQIDRLTRWIDAGAPWQQHWSFVPPSRPELPQVSQPDWPLNPIDHFVLARLEAKGWSPALPAAPETLARRVSLDLTGLPPTPEQVARLVADPSLQTYEALVDELLRSPHYGERMAMVWLDAARYADTDGFQIDETRTNWPWRDWVIEAYNTNMPFDEFTIAQFAGDLLPDATADQQLATSFHRHHMTNGEGGRDPEESRIDYVIDRVNTMGTVWLGLTLGCCQCHSHKYDPISQREYYQLASYFNSIDEDGRAGTAAGPHLAVTSRYAQDGLEESRRWLESRQQRLAAVEAAALSDFPEWVSQKRQMIIANRGHLSWHRPEFAELLTTGGTRLAANSAGMLQVDGPNPRHDDYILAARSGLNRVTAMRLQVLPEDQQGRGTLSLAEDGHLILTNLKIYRQTPGVGTEDPIDISSAVADHQGAASGRVYGPVATVLDDDPRTGWTTTGREPTESRTAVFAFAEPIELTREQQLVVELRHRSLSGHAAMRRFTIEFTDELGPLRTQLGPSPLEQLAESIRGQIDLPTEADQALQQQFLAQRPEVEMARDELMRARQRVKQYEQSLKPVNVMVLRERAEPRTTHVLVRGVWDKKGEEVSAGLPDILTTVMASESTLSEASSRLELARWLVHPSHPLTARVAVNRHWQMLFGSGLINTPDDLGSQGEAPTHPELLDWLSVEFMESGWDVKHLLKLIVTSATYRQRSDLTNQLRQVDPGNRWLARGARFRLPSWMIRDVALASSGLLSRRLGGPPVFPTQPPGAWADSTMGRFHYQQSVGDDLYRRSVYAFWRRSVAPTVFFDASKRRVCQVRMVRTNTPLHALTLLNDLSMLAAARALAQSTRGDSADDAQRLQILFQRVLSRDIRAQEQEILMRQIAAMRSHYTAHVDEASELVGDSESFEVDKEPLVELAVWTMVGSTLLNMDEAITRE